MTLKLWPLFDLLAVRLGVWVWIYTFPSAGLVPSRHFLSVSGVLPLPGTQRLRRANTDGKVTGLKKTSQTWRVTDGHSRVFEFSDL